MSVPARVAVLGAGFIADHYLRALGSIRGHEVAVVMSRTAHSARSLADKYEVPDIAATVEEVVARGDIDLAIIALPHDLHVPVVKTLAAAGIGIVCTKPLGRSGAEAETCLAAVTDAGVWHGYAESAVFAPALAAAHRYVKGGAIGKVLWVRSREAHGHPHTHARDPERMGGGPLRGLGIHCIAIGRLMLDGAAPVEAFAWGDCLYREDVEVEDNVLLMLRFADGRVVQVESSWTHVAGLDVRTEVHGSDGWIQVDETGGSDIKMFSGGNVGVVVEKGGSENGWLHPVPEETFTYGFHAQLEHFVHAFNAGETPSQTFRDGVIDNTIVDAGYRAMSEQRWVPIRYPSSNG